MVSTGSSLKNDESALWDKVQSKPDHLAFVQQWDVDPVQNTVPIKPCSEQGETWSL